MPQHDGRPSGIAADPLTAELWRVAGWTYRETDPADWLDQHTGSGRARVVERALVAELRHNRAELAAVRAERDGTTELHPDQIRALRGYLDRAERAPDRDARIAELHQLAGFLGGMLDVPWLAQ